MEGLKMKKWFTAITAILLVMLLTACGTAAQDEPFVWPQSVDGQSPFYGETLTVGVASARGGATRNFRTIARLYMHENPGVTIEIIDSGFEYDFDLARERVGLEFMAGTAPMLIETMFLDRPNPSPLDYLHPAIAQHFADWLPIIAADPYFDEDDWYMNVFDALSADGRLIGFPITYDTMWGNTYIVVNTIVPGLLEMVGDRQTISITEMMEIHSQIAPTLDRPMYIESRFHTINAVGNNIDAFFDFETGRVEFNTPEFIEFITLARELTSPRRDANPPNFSATLGNREHNHFESQNYLFRRTWTSDFGIFDIFEEDIPFANPILLGNDNGEMLITPFNTMILNNAATDTQKALALDFLRFSMLHEDAVSTTHHYTAISSSARRLDEVFTRRTFNTVDTHVFRRDGWSLRENSSYALAAVRNNTTAAGEMPMRDARYAPGIVREAIYEILLQFHDGLLTAEQAAVDLQNRVVLMLMEMD